MTTRKLMLSFAAILLGSMFVASASADGVRVRFGYSSGPRYYSSCGPRVVYSAPRYYAPPVYVRSYAPVYVAPAPVYVAPAPVYVAPAPVYYDCAPVVYRRPIVYREVGYGYREYVPARYSGTRVGVSFYYGD